MRFRGNDDEVRVIGLTLRLAPAHYGFEFALILELRAIFGAAVGESRDPEPLIPTLWKRTALDTGIRRYDDFRGAPLRRQSFSLLRSNHGAGTTSGVGSVRALADA